MEDADDGDDNNRKKAVRNNFSSNVSNMIQMQQDAMERFGDCMDQGYKMIAEFARSAQEWNEDKKDDIEKMHVAVVVIEKLERKIEMLKRDFEKIQSSNPLKSKMIIAKLNAIEKSFAKAYKSLDDE